MQRSISARVALLLVAIPASVVAGTTLWRRASVDNSLVAVVRRGDLTAQLTTTGTLKPIQSITYRSPLAGRETEIIELVPEGTRVKAGDLLIRLDTTELQRDVERAKQEVRQGRMDLQVAEIEKKEAEAALKGVSEGEGALAVDEARTRAQVVQKKVERLRRDYEQLKPLMDKGFITRDEVKKTADDLEQSEEDLTLAQKRADVVIGLAHPRDTQHANLQLAQKESQLENARARALEADARLQLLLDQVENCRIYARRPGMVVYEEFLSANPRRKIRVGDRMTGSQGLVTIPEMSRMLLEASVSEAEVHHVRPGQAALVRVEAFPNQRLSGTVARVGTLARASADRPFEDKRFDLIVELDATDVDLRPEMTARADVIVGTRTDVLIVPVNAVFDEQGTIVAHVRQRSGVETRAVDLGEANDTLVEIVHGVREGEQVMLTSPGAAATPAPIPPGGGRGAAIGVLSTHAPQPR